MLGGKLSLNDLRHKDIEHKNIDSKTIKDIVAKALTIKNLKKLESKKDSDDERLENDIRLESVRDLKR